MRHWTLFALMFGVLLCGAVGQENNFDQFTDPPKTPEARPAENIALNAAYTLEPAPSYSYCTDPGDAVQLTDGVYSEGYFWVQKTTVGWQRKHPVVVTVDLGEDKPIRGVSFDTAAGTAGVTWPLTIHVLVAGEDKQFHAVGDLVTFSAANGLPPAEGYATHRYWTDALRTHGRYVAFAFPAQPYGFVDEIEVYEGEPEWLGAPLTGPSVADVTEHIQALVVKESIIRRLRRDIHTVREKAEEGTVPESVRREVLAELDAITGQMDAIPAEYDDDFRTVLPINDLHVRILRAQAKLWEGQGLPPLTVWQTGLWDRLEYAVDPPESGGAAVNVHMMRNEYRAGCFNVSNATQASLELAVRIQGLPGGTTPDYVVMHECLWTDTKSGQPVAAALPEAPRRDGAYIITVPSGFTRQVWLTFHPTDIEPGLHEGTIQLEGGPEPLEVPVRLEVYPIRFPDQPTLHFGGWDYTNGTTHRGVTPANMDAVLEHLQTRFVDSPWATNAVMPAGAYDGDGNMVTEPDTANFDEWRARWPNARQYLVFSAVGDTFAGLASDEPRFAKAVGAWTKFWERYMRDKGLEPGQLGLLLVDEPGTAEQDARIVVWAKAIRAASTAIRIWEDPTYGDISQANPEMIALCDVLCPNRSIFLRGSQVCRDFYVAQRDAGKQLEFYLCGGPVRALDPYAYHRLQAWSCWRYDAKATYFWALGDTGGGTSWNEYAAAGTDYTPYFLGPDSATPGKHMEACREGVEDFEYLVMLRDAIAEAEKNGVSGPVLEEARTLLADAPNRVLDSGTSGSLMWDSDVDRTVADEVRHAILDALVALVGDDSI